MTNDKGALLKLAQLGITSSLCGKPARNSQGETNNMVITRIALYFQVCMPHYIHDWHGQVAEARCV